MKTFRENSIVCVSRHENRIAFQDSRILLPETFGNENSLLCSAMNVLSGVSENWHLAENNSHVEASLLSLN